MKQRSFMVVLFVLLIAAGLGAMGWISREALRLEKAEASARQLAAREESARLALWRMETALAPLITLESSRPWQAFQSFYETESIAAAKGGDTTRVLSPSPLLAARAPEVKLYFRVDEIGGVTSPEVPFGEERSWALEGYTTEAAIAESETQLDEFAKSLDSTQLVAALPAMDSGDLLPVVIASAPVQQMARPTGQQGKYVYEQQAEIQQQELNDTEMQARQMQNIVNLDTSQGYGSLSNRLASSSMTTSAEAPARALWIGKQLLIARRVQSDGESFIVGTWLNWQVIEKNLLESIKDLFPNARLNPDAETTAAPGYRLASVPITLIPGDPAKLPVYSASLTPFLLLAWTSLLIALASIGALMWASMSLSERRRLFVSSVTHELRTPLTTFRLYTEMLLDGMVTDEEKRREYLATLHNEADRLTHLVENVLSYARLERRKNGGELVDMTVSDFVNKVSARLEQRAAQAGFLIEWKFAPDVSTVDMRLNPNSLDQILFNLVDNACKYAAGAEDARIVLSCVVHPYSVEWGVQDFGPGMPAHRRRNPFRAFSKSSEEAAQTAPGIGLGLELSRRLAKAMGGDVVLDGGTEAGTRFVVRVKKQG